MRYRYINFVCFIVLFHNFSSRSPVVDIVFTFFHHQVTLQDWFCLICRPFLGLNMILNWITVVSYCTSPSSIYSAYFTTLMTSPLLYVIVNDFKAKLLPIQYKSITTR